MIYQPRCRETLALRISLSNLKVLLSEFRPGLHRGCCSCRSCRKALLH